MLHFRTACLVTGWLFVPLSLAVLLLTNSWVPQYINDEALWALGVDNFRFIAALNFTVGALLLAMSRGELDVLAQYWVAFVMALGVAILAGVHVVVLSANTASAGASPRWTATLYADTVFFTLIALYWALVTFRLSGEGTGGRRVAA